MDGWTPRTAAELVLEHANDGSAAEYLARLVLAEHHADENEPLTREWWMTVFGREFVDCHTFGMWFRKSGCKVMESREHNTPSYKIETPCKTRGDVRRLCAALGIELKGG